MEGLLRTIERGQELPSAQERLLRQQGMRGYIEEYRLGMEQGTIDPGLLPYQEPHFPKVLDHFLTHLKTPVNPQDPDLLDRLTYVQTADAAMGFGKSFFLARMAEAVGIGRPAHQYSEAPLRALYLSYRTLGVDEIYKACSKFVPNITATRHEGAATKKSVSGQIVVMTYKALCHMIQAQAAGRPTVLDGHFFDLIGTDENHHRWAEEFRTAVDTVARGALEYGQSGTLRTSIKGREPPPVSFRHRIRTMVDDGDAPSVQLLGFPTGQELKAKPRTDDAYAELDQEFTLRETGPLALSTERNVQIVETLKKFASLGRVTLAGMIPGGGQDGKSCLHARLIEELVNSETIVDPITGKERRLNFAAIGRFLPSDEVDNLLERSKIPFGEEDSIDGLLSTSLLTESWDNPNLGALLAACPYSYGQLAQLIGRLMRKGPHEVVILAQLLDRITGSRRPAFLPEVFDESEFFNGMVIGPKEVEEHYNTTTGWKKSSPGRDPSAPKEPADKARGSTPAPLSEVLILASAVQKSRVEWDDAMDVYLTERRDVPVVSEMIAAGQRLILDEPPKGSARLQDLFGLPNVAQSGIGKHALYDLLRANDFTYSLVDVSGGAYENYVHDGKGVIAFLEEYEFPDKKEEERRNLQELTVELSTSRQVLEGIVAKLAAEGHDMTTESRRSLITKREEDTWGPAQIALFEAEIAARKAAEPPEPAEGKAPLVLVSAAADEAGVSRKDYRRFIESTFNTTLDLYNSPERDGRQAAYCTKEQKERAQFHFSLPKVPDDAILAEAIGQRFEKSVEEVIAAAEACGCKDAVKQGSQLLQVRVNTPEGVRWAPGSEYAYPYFFETREAAATVRKYFKDQASKPAAEPVTAAASPPETEPKTTPAPKPQPQPAAEPQPEPQPATTRPAAKAAALPQPVTFVAATPASAPRSPAPPTPEPLPPPQTSPQPQPPAHLVPAAESAPQPQPAPQPAHRPRRTAWRNPAPQPATPAPQTLEIPANYHNIEEGLAILDARCDPALINWLITRSRNRMAGTPRRDKGGWFAPDDDIQALAEVVMSYPLAQPAPAMETPPQIAGRHKIQGVDVIPLDIMNLFQHNIGGMPRLVAPENQVTHCRSIPGTSMPSTLRLYFRSQLIQAVDQRINRLSRGRLLYQLHRLRKG